MRKWLTASLFFTAFFLVSCGGSSDVITRLSGPKKNIVAKTDPKIYSLIGDLYTGTKMYPDDSKEQGDTKIYLWNGIKMYFITNSTEHPAGGNYYLRMVVGPSVDWFGWGIHSVPKTYKNMSGFENGHLKFWMKTKNSGDFKIGVKHGFVTESWMDFEDGKYGFVKDGKWHQVSVPLASFFPKIKFNTVNVWFMMSQASGASPKGGSAYDITEIWWTKD